MMKDLVLTRQGYTVSPSLFDMIREVLGSTVRQEKEIKDVREREKKKKKLFPTSGGLIVYVQSPEEATKTS